ncbi:Bcr/CflA family drug resistance efflux transporter [Patiriisocius marinistellae]|uniref:Bcr/CflA family drug resistance efflux transporter n=1 Tax=Patiriisocius marinistellae TaxID=2494560 RepID=A0A5J4FYG6_9FLAO|nr:multidrug effflux MFS transporter [Patiriisocius marinistellae]GEQ86418.1 Bcr/CflA family drug resistance efflux transporter [Patiriisocius marinistellae]
MQKPTNPTSQTEFIALMAALMAAVALAIDAVLPALDAIGVAINTTQVADNQFIILAIFMGLGIGPLLFGALSDALGRRPLVLVGFFIFIGASFICVFAQSLEVMIIGRVLQGVGLSAPRTMAIAIIRDKYSGDYMARIMSFVTVVFLLVPVIAPALGKFVMDAYNWQMIFYAQLFFCVIVGVWFYMRQPETLIEAHRKKFSFKEIAKGFPEVLKTKSSMAYTLIWGFVTGSFMVYLSASQQIFRDHYNLEEEFPFIFAGLAITIGASTFLNGTLVLKFGMRRLVTFALFSFFGVSTLYILLFSSGVNPPVEVLVGFFAIQFFSIGFLFGNLRSLAMQPLGHIAGIGAAITGFIATFMAIPMSAFIGRFLATSSLPLFIGFAVCSGISLIILFGTKRFLTSEM